MCSPRARRRRPFGLGSGAATAAPRRRGARAADDVDALDRALQDPMEQLGDARDQRPRAGPRRQLLGVEAAPDHHRHEVGGQRRVPARVGDAERAQQRHAGAVGDVGRPLGPGLLVAARRLVRGEHGGPGGMQVHELADPGGQVVEAGGVRRHQAEPLGQRHHLAAQAAGQRPEHLVLAGEVLVEGRARAAGSLGDRLDPCLREAHLGEDLQGRAQDATLGVTAPLADERVGTEGRSPHDAGVHGLHGELI